SRTAPLTGGCDLFTSRADRTPAGHWAAAPALLMAGHVPAATPAFPAGQTAVWTAAFGQPSGTAAQAAGRAPQAIWPD
ncbi:MAG TPA: hypothetical protein PLB64_08605, partial [Kiritimatiellia bacterium]|nr:hypothetical protein [Kiritimatiellia bacterium]